MQLNPLNYKLMCNIENIIQNNNAFWYEKDIFFNISLLVRHNVILNCFDL